MPSPLSAPGRLPGRSDASQGHPRAKEGLSRIVWYQHRTADGKDSAKAWVAAVVWLAAFQVQDVSGDSVVSVAEPDLA